MTQENFPKNFEDVKIGIGADLTRGWNGQIDEVRMSCWQKEFFENGAAAFQAKGRSDQPAEQERIEYLEKKIRARTKFWLN